MLGHGQYERFPHDSHPSGPPREGVDWYAARMASPHLQRKLKETLGSDAGQELADVTDGIAAVRNEVAELRQEMREGFVQTRLEWQKAINDQTRFFFVAWAVNLAAIVGLYGTVIALIR